MSMNKFMHSRNIYKTPPNFKELAISYPEFCEYAQNKFDGSVAFDFKNPNGLRCLTTILLKKDFNLDVSIPENNLVPTLPLRLNYILWLEDLLNYNSETKSSIRGIDIGTGATCIFPLLAAKKNGWKMLATEINESSVCTALENIKRNSLEELISVKLVSQETFLKGIFDDGEQFDFCMCNPPFFNDESDLDCSKKSRTGNKRKEPNNGQTGVAQEIISCGGELEFIRNIIRDSVLLKDRIKIYTTMMGHKSSYEMLVKEFQDKNINFCQTQFCQGHTVRWGIAWTFGDSILKDLLPSPRKKTKPISWVLNSKYNFKECVELLPDLLTKLKIQFTPLESYKRRHLWKIIAFENTWTGLRRKRREMRRMAQLQESLAASSNHPTKSSLEEPMEVQSEPHEENNTSRKLTLNDDIFDIGPKRSKLTSDDDTKDLVDPLVEAFLCITSEKNNKVQVQITSVSGFKEAPQQLLQYLKNQLESGQNEIPIPSEDILQKDL